MFQNFRVTLAADAAALFEIGVVIVKLASSFADNSLIKKRENTKPRKRGFCEYRFVDFVTPKPSGRRQRSAVMPTSD